MGKPILANCYIEFCLGKERLGVVAMVSETGAHRIQFGGLPLSRVMGMLGRPLDAIIAGKVPVKGHLVKEVQQAGSDFRFEFDLVIPQAIPELHRLIKATGHPAPWSRSVERFQVGSALTGEHPNEAKVKLVSSKHELVADVENFSAHGLQLVGHGELFSEWRVGQIAEIELSTNEKQSFAPVHARILRVEETHERDLNQSTYHFGIEIEAINEFVKRRYYAMLEKLASAEADYEEAA